MDRAEAVAAFADAKMRDPSISISEFARSIGVHQETLRRWYNQATDNKGKVERLPEEVKIAVAEGYLKVKQEGGFGAVNQYERLIREALGCSRSVIRKWRYKYCGSNAV